MKNKTIEELAAETKMLAKRSHARFEDIKALEDRIHHLEAQLEAVMSIQDRLMIELGWEI